LNLKCDILVSSLCFQTGQLVNATAREQLDALTAGTLRRLKNAAAVAK
jgi:hypothetical protein